MAKDIDSIFFDITPKIEELALKCEQNNAIDKELYTKYEVKRGLRDLNGKGVLAGLTNISDVCAFKMVDGKQVPCKGNLYYRGYNIKDLVKGFLAAHHPGFEETAYLLLFGELPDKAQLKEFQEMIAERRMLPPNFVRDVIMKAPSRDMMNSITRSILQLYSYDDKADDTSIPNVLRQCLNLISQFPMLMVYGYHAYNYKRGEDLYIYAPQPELSTAENILMMLRENRKYTKLEAEDFCTWRLFCIWIMVAVIIQTFTTDVWRLLCGTDNVLLHIAAADGVLKRAKAWRGECKGYADVRRYEGDFNRLVR